MEKLMKGMWLWVNRCAYSHKTLNRTMERVLIRDAPRSEASDSEETRGHVHSPNPNQVVSRTPHCMALHGCATMHHDVRHPCHDHNSFCLHQTFDLYQNLRWRPHLNIECKDKQ